MVLDEGAEHAVDVCKHLIHRPRSIHLRERGERKCLQTSHKCTDGLQTVQVSLNMFPTAHVDSRKPVLCFFIYRWPACPDALAAWDDLHR